MRQVPSDPAAPNTSEDAGTPKSQPGDGARSPAPGGVAGTDANAVAKAAPAAAASGEAKVLAEGAQTHGNVVDPAVGVPAAAPLRGRADATEGASALGDPQAAEGPKGLAARIQAFREKHAMAEIALLLVAGFLFDVFTLSRIDDVSTLAQQGAYLGVLGWLLLLEQRYALGVATPSGWWAKVWRFSEEAVHFLFGSLLSCFTVFYFKSASGWTSLLFLAVIFTLLIVNELPRFRALGPMMRVALFSLCLTSYFAYLLPVLAGMVRPWLFVVAVLLSCGVTLSYHLWVATWTQSKVAGFKNVLLPGVGVQVLLLVLYFLKVTPPVPLSITEMGIYHDVRREGSDYLLSHQRPDWRFWHKGDQYFLAREGDKVWVFVSVFAPRRFQDQIVARWWYDDPKRGWVSRGNKVLEVRGGGRESGFRTNSYMTYRGVPGRYRVEITTLTGHVIGQLNLEVVADPDRGPREFKIVKG